MGLATSMSRFAGMATSYVSQYDNITYSFYLYGLSGVVATICTLLLKHDTKGMDMTNDTKSKSKLLPIESDQDNNDANTLKSDQLMFSMH